MYLWIIVICFFFWVAAVRSNLDISNGTQNWAKWYPKSSHHNYFLSQKLCKDSVVFFIIYEFILLNLNSLNSRYTYSNHNHQFIYTSLWHFTIHFKVRWKLASFQTSQCWGRQIQRICWPRCRKGDWFKRSYSWGSRATDETTPSCWFCKSSLRASGWSDRRREVKILLNPFMERSSSVTLFVWYDS